jgi:hypothetical protein
MPFTSGTHNYRIFVLIGVTTFCYSVVVAAAMGSSPTRVESQTSNRKSKEFETMSRWSLIVGKERHEHERKEKKKAKPNHRYHNSSRIAILQAKPGHTSPLHSSQS